MDIAYATKDLRRKEDPRKEHEKRSLGHLNLKIRTVHQVNSNLKSIILREHTYGKTRHK